MPASASEDKQVQNERKKAKDQRKKVLADLLVQGTNDSSIVSKRSVERLYSASVHDGEEEVPHFFQHFVKKPQRRSPAINRGYWIRVNAIRKSIDKIVKAEGCKQNVIVNLGCGYDPIPFQIIDSKSTYLQSSSADNDFLCIDIDYPELISLKVEMIKNSPELMKIIGEVDVSCKIEGVQLKTSNYAAVGCNLRDLELFQRQLTELGLHGLDTCSIFIAEVSLAYMLPEHADAVIKESSTFPKSHFLILEQLLATGEERHPFGRTMLHHFKRLNTPLQCVSTYRTISDQIARFQHLGFPNVEARDLLGCWDELISEHEKRKVRSVEAFDEFEEFVFYTQHYVVAHATNSIQCCFNQENKIARSLSRDDSFHLAYTNVTNPEQRKFASSALLRSGELLNVAGSSERRLNTVSVLSKQFGIHELKVRNQDILPARMCHTFTPIGEDEYLLIGGRNAPHRLFDDCWKLSKAEEWEWTQLTAMSQPRSRHCTVKLNDEEVLVFGGLTDSSDSSTFSIYNFKSDRWSPVGSSGDIVGNLKSATLTYDNESGKGYLAGGLDVKTKIINQTLFEFEVSHGEVHLKKLLDDDLLQRYGAKMCHLPSVNKLVLAGGANDNYALDQSSTVVSIDLETLEIKSVYFSDDLWVDGSIFVGFDMLVQADGSIVCTGGGAVCFGFGSFWNDKVLTISTTPMGT